MRFVNLMKSHGKKNSGGSGVLHSLSDALKTFTFAAPLQGG